LTTLFAAKSSRNNYPSYTAGEEVNHCPGIEVFLRPDGFGAAVESDMALCRKYCHLVAKA
jgi:hypothetical protein